MMHLNGTHPDVAAQMAAGLPDPASPSVAAGEPVAWGGSVYPGRPYQVGDIVRDERRALCRVESICDDGVLIVHWVHANGLIDRLPLMVADAPTWAAMNRAADDTEARMRA